MKKFLPIVFLIISNVYLSQNDQKSPGRGNSTSQVTSASAAFASSVLSDTCLDKKFSVVFYLINDSAYNIQLSNPLSYAGYQLSLLINQMNAAFAPICVSFEHCKTVIIPVYPFNRWRAGVLGDHITSTWYTDKTINIYIPKLVMPIPPDPPDNCYAYTHPGNDTVVPRDAIILDSASVYEKNGIGYVGAPLMHALGHYFGLPHTFAEINPTVTVNPPPPPGCCSPAINTKEFVDRTDFNNCHTHGDGFCDTEADPFPSFIATSLKKSSKDCSGSPGLKDGKGNFYKPPTDNFMSFYGCRCRYSKEQLNFMARYMMTKRKYLH
ncbi:MAG: hypothetical protein JNL60_15200 [Bacteroidia bacterium]|nr:hypothetical protein [Bacteroidia bacterium]